MTFNENEVKSKAQEKNENPIPSIFRLNLLEILLGIVAGILLVLSFRYNLWSLQPYTFEASHAEWFVEYRSDLLLSLGWFYFLLGFVAAVSLIRFLQKRYHIVPNLGQISPIGYLAFTWPILLLIPDIQLIFNLSLFICWPVIFVIVVVICTFSIREYGHRGNLFPILFNLAASLPFIYNTIGIWALIGD